MTLRTPRRRISPRTRQRYRAIKGFFKRAIGGSSQPDLATKASTVNVTDLQHKIVGLEQQLSEVSKTCREFIYLEASRRESQILLPTEKTNQPQLRRDDSTGREQAKETKIIYQKPDNNHRKTEESNNTLKHDKILDNGDQNNLIEYDETTTGKKKNRKVQNIAKHSDMELNERKMKTKLKYDCLESAYSTTSFHSLNELKEGHHHSHPNYSGDKLHRRLHKIERNIHLQKNNVRKEQIKRVVPINYDSRRVDRTTKHAKSRKAKNEGNELDQNFIADIIKRQYKPVQMFGRRESDISQLSDPMCRDRDLKNYDNIQEDTELCNCCCGGRHRHIHNSDVRSVCDTRLYSLKKKPRFNKYRRCHADAYNDSELYDLIPVKEKTSPKSRRKFARDNSEHYHDYREVPPSPRTHRPRLNLKAQNYTESDDDHTDLNPNHNKRLSPERHHKYEGPTESCVYDNSLQMHTHKQNQHRDQLSCKPVKVHQEMGTTSSMQYAQRFDVEQNNRTTDTFLNNTQGLGSSSDKTDRALFEIKDILQSFLQEIKKETSSSDKSDVSTKVTETCMSSPNPHVNVIPSSGHSFNYGTPHCSSAPPPFIMPTYHNTCCYPVLPMYSMNCMQSGFVMPSPSFTCGCSKTEESTNKNKANNTAGNDIIAGETEELIKEIYNFVAQSPTFSRKQEANIITENPNNHDLENKVYTTRSVGGSRKVSKHDATVETQAIKCYSKSCEAIGTRMISGTYCSETNPTTYSDSTGENISLEATATTSFVTEISTERSEKQRTSSSNNRFGKVLRAFGLFKKRKETIEEESESESTIDVVINKSKPPFQQEVTSYMMSNQVYDRRPATAKDYRQPSQYLHDYHSSYNQILNYPPPPPNDPYYDPRPQQQEFQKGGGPHYHPGYPSAPPCTNYENFNPHHPQVPLCLKEIEVKSMATQSERKMSFFRKIKQKMQPPDQKRDDGPRNFATQTKQEKPGLWKSLQAKAAEGKNEPLAFSFQQQKKLNSTDNNLRNAMLKKMFYKRNPFSPRNLIVRTLMGKDKSSYGAPPAMYRPSMFI